MTIVTTTGEEDEDIATAVTLVETKDAEAIVEADQVVEEIEDIRVRDQVI